MSTAEAWTLSLKPSKNSINSKEFIWSKLQVHQWWGIEWYGYRLPKSCRKQRTSVAGNILESITVEISLDGNMVYL